MVSADGQRLVVAAGADLDYESLYPNPSLTVKVRSTDSGSPPQSRVEDFTVNILDVNEAPTAILAQGKWVVASVSSDRLALPEDLMVGSEVATFKIEDPDRDQSHACSITGPSNTPFSLRRSGNTTALLLSSALDYEVEQRHEVRISCEDTGLPSKAHAATIIVDVTNVNEVPSAVTLSGAPLVFANSTMGTTIGYIQCSDVDARVEANKEVVTLSIVPTANSSLVKLVSLTASSAEQTQAGQRLLQVAVSLRDYDIDRISLQIRCEDKGGLAIVTPVEIGVVPADYSTVPILVNVRLQHTPSLPRPHSCTTPHNPTLLYSPRYPKVRRCAPSTSPPPRGAWLSDRNAFTKCVHSRSLHSHPPSLRSYPFAHHITVCRYHRWRDARQRVGVHRDEARAYRGGGGGGGAHVRARTHDRRP